MAFHDDVGVLLSYLRHSFVTNDDTGVCELVMVQEDLETEMAVDRSFQNRGRLMAKRSLPRPSGLFAKSYDITNSAPLCSRPPRREDRNAFDMAEIKTKMKADKCKTVVWKEPTRSPDLSMFERVEVGPRPKETAPSRLGLLLAEYYEQTANPFFDYARLDGQNHQAVSLTNTFMVFLAVVPDLPSVEVTILSDATVEDLIGLTLFKYTQEHGSAEQFKSVKDYCVRIAEDDGEIDSDFPSLDKHEKIGKFGFTSLGITEVDPSEQKHFFVEIHYEDGGSSKLAVPTLDLGMDEILKSAMKKRQLPLSTTHYHLEKSCSRDVPVGLTETLESQNTLVFHLVRKRKGGQLRNSHPGEGGEEEDMSEIPAPEAALTSDRYVNYSVIMLNKMRSKTKVTLGISGEQVDIQPLGKGLFAVKAMSYEIDRICACEYLEEKGGRCVVRIVRSSKDGGFKEMDFEVDDLRRAKEIVQKMESILKTRPTKGRRKYLERASK